MVHSSVLVISGFVVGVVTKSVVEYVQTILAKQMGGTKKVAVVLSGCGVYDGSEITEAVSCLIHLSHAHVEIKVFAPDMKQHHVINHITGEEMQINRNVLIESARIARGDIAKLELLKANDFDAVIFPGGFGAAKNLSTFAFDSVKCTILPEVERVLTEFQKAKKVIGMACISPVIAAKVFPSCQVTVGQSKGDKWPYGETVDSIRSMGSQAIEKKANEVHIDAAFKLVTAPAYMYAGSPFEIFSNVGRMVEAVLKLA